MPPRSIAILPLSQHVRLSGRVLRNVCPFVLPWLSPSPGTALAVEHWRGLWLPKRPLCDSQALMLLLLERGVDASCVMLEKLLTSESLRLRADEKPRFFSSWSLFPVQMNMMLSHSTPIRPNDVSYSPSPWPLSTKVAKWLKYPNWPTPFPPPPVRMAIYLLTTFHLSRLIKLHTFSKRTLYTVFRALCCSVQWTNSQWLPSGSSHLLPIVCCSVHDNVPAPGLTLVF